jgi:hypothetical protein
MGKSRLLSLILAGSVLLSGCNISNLLPIKPKKTFQQKQEEKIMDCFYLACDKYESEEKGTDYWKSPSETRESGKGDCEDKAIYLWDLLKKEGIFSMFQVGLMNSNDEESCHGWVELSAKGYDYVLDPTQEKIYLRVELGENRYKSYTEGFGLGDKFFEFYKRTGIENSNIYYQERITWEKINNKLKTSTSILSTNLN